MVAQGENFHQTLAGEYHNEYHVQVIQHVAERCSLLVVVERHGQHVQTDEQHDNHVKLLVRYYLEYYCLWSPLKNKKKLITVFMSVFFCFQ